MIISILAIVLVFGTIVFVHEFGHMLAAKSCGVAVPDFALGMGPSLKSFYWRGTRYHLCAVPIGGFVRIAGMEGDAADAPGLAESGYEHSYEQTWQSKNGWQKAIILVAGPAMNFLLAAIIVLCMGFTGFPERLVMLGLIEPNSPAGEAGLRPGDVINSINGEEIKHSRHFSQVVQANTGSDLEISLRRDYETLTVNTRARVLIDETTGEPFNDGKPSLGVGLFEIDQLTTTVSLVQAKTKGYNLPAMKRLDQPGLKAGDRLTEINGLELNAVGQLLQMLPDATQEQTSEEAVYHIEPATAEQFELTVKRNDMDLTFILPKNLPRQELAKVLGSALVVHEYDPASPLSQLAGYEPVGTKGVKIGDRMLTIDGGEVATGQEVYSICLYLDSDGNLVDADSNAVTAQTGSAHVMVVERDGTELAFITPWDVSGLNLGLLFRPQLAKLPLGDSIKRSLEDGRNMMYGMFAMVGLLFTKQGAQSVSGPLGIGELIGQSARSGWYTFLQIVMLININLGLLNLLPLPALDGGRLVFVALGGIGLRVPEKREAMVHAIGMVMLLGLIAIITIGDVMSVIGRNLN